MIEAKETTKKIRVALIKEASQGFNTYDVRAEAGTKIEEVLCPAYWSNFAINAHVHDMLNVRTDDNAWRAILTVVSVGEKWIKVFPMVYTDMRKETIMIPPIESLYDTKLCGPKRWCIIRKSDKEIVKENISTGKEAYEELKRIEAATQG